MGARLVHMLFCSLALGACAGAQQWSGPLPSPDGKQFTSDVYPLLLNDCAFTTCHGAKDRFFQVFGPGRNRLDPTTTKPDDPLTLAEVQHSYDRARSMLITAPNLDDSLLLRKPLELGAGGQGHKGVDDFGRNLFASRDDPGYQLLYKWAHSTGMSPTAADVAALAAPAMQ